MLEAPSVDVKEEAPVAADPEPEKQQDPVASSEVQEVASDEVAVPMETASNADVQPSAEESPKEDPPKENPPEEQVIY